MAPPEESRPAVVTVDVRTAVRELELQQYHHYLDVRTEEEMDKGHLHNSLNIPYMFITPQGREKNPLFVEQVASLLNKDQHILVGFASVKNLGGGYLAWIDNGFPVVSQQPPVTGPAAAAAVSQQPPVTSPAAAV